MHPTRQRLEALRSRLAGWLHGGAGGESGADMAEYAWLLLLIAVVAFSIVQSAGDQVTCAYEKVVQGLRGNAPMC
jgi:Flp pilus assembly pilin Flp